MIGPGPRRATRRLPRADAATDGRLSHAFRRSKPRGFTLIEALVGIALGGLILSVTVGVAAQAVKVTRRAQVMQTFMREGEFISAVLQQTFRTAGVGVPENDHIEGAIGGLQSVVSAGATFVGILGDMPRPHAQYSTFGYLHQSPGNNKSRINWHTENNGTCVPSPTSDTVPCDIAAASIFFPGDASRCRGATAAAFNRRTCAWGMKRAEEDDVLQIVGASGNWTEGILGNTMESNGDPPATRRQMAVLSTAFDDGLGLWGNGGSDEPPWAEGGIGWVTTLDRVFFRVFDPPGPATQQLQRRQCWGRADATDGNWPTDTGNAIPADPTIAPNPESVCSAWEPLISNVQSATFSFADSTGNVIPVGSMTTAGTKDTIRRIDYNIHLRRVVFDVPIEHFIIGSVAIRNGY